MSQNYTWERGSKIGKKSETYYLNGPLLSFEHDRYNRYNRYTEFGYVFIHLDGILPELSVISVLNRIHHMSSSNTDSGKI